MSRQNEENDDDELNDVELKQLHSPAPIPANLPVLPLRNTVLLPDTVMPINIGRPRSLELIDEALRSDRLLATVLTTHTEDSEPRPQDLPTVACAAQVLRVERTEQGNLHILLQGLTRIELKEWLERDPFLKAAVMLTPAIEPAATDLEAKALRHNLEQQFRRLVMRVQYLTADLLETALQAHSYQQFSHLIAASLRLEPEQLQQVLTERDPVIKLRLLTEWLNRELELVKIGEKIQKETTLELNKSQRDYFLRQQLKAIQKELGEQGPVGELLETLREKITSSGMPEEANQAAVAELARLERIPESSSEYNVSVNWLDWMVSLPWAVRTADNLDLAHARTVLDDDHHDLEQVKERLIEFLAVRKLRAQAAADEAGSKPLREGGILCLLGPPGVGKTSLGQSIARALGRKFHRISLGGLRDEAEIRGHRRTYVGAMPGQFVKAMRRVGSSNPVILLDELDKLGADWRGDPAAALLEVLDPEQNRQFRDLYLDQAFDLSAVLFIATANVADTIPGPLLDRLEVITLSGYTDEQKLHIAQRFLLNRQVRESGLHDGDVHINDAGMLKVIRDYTREAGVRNLERQLARICRKLATRIAGGAAAPFSLAADDIPSLLGKPLYHYDLAARTARPGVATGLAVTAVGGDVLFVEASKMPGPRGFRITGQLGAVMQESAQAAFSYVRAQSTRLGIDANFFADHELHLHVPAGAIPKDGPSAGVTIATALASLATGHCVRADIGMTGELSLHGLVLPVGGIRDKVLAAQRAGLTTVLLPLGNEADVAELPDTVRTQMTITLVSHVDEVFAQALQPPLVGFEPAPSATDAQRLRA